jgi:hypothetical protein
MLLRPDATWPRIAEVNSWVSTALVAFAPNPFTESTRWSWPGQAGALTALDLTQVACSAFCGARACLDTIRLGLSLLVGVV